MAWHLAQLNVARWAVDPDGPDAEPFLDGLDPVNATADAADGFVWRLQDESGNATGFQMLDDPLLIVNLSVWRDLDALLDFVRSKLHAGFLRRRREWFVPLDEPTTVLWWVPAGHVPTVEEAQARLLRLRREGPGPEAFTFGRPHPAPSA